MTNTGDFSDEEQSTTLVRDYRTLLETTRPLVVAAESLLSLRADRTLRSGFAMLPDSGDCAAELKLKRGEIFRSESAEAGENGGLEPTDDLPEGDLGLGIRIHFGMS